MDSVQSPAPSVARWFKGVAIAEGISFLLLLGIAMPLKYMAGMPQAVQVVGWLHGVLFVAYGLLGLLTVIQAKWPLERLSGIFLAGVIPFGTFVLERKWLR